MGISRGDSEHIEPIECPNCGQIEYVPIGAGMDQNGQEFVEYECRECKAYGTF